nr:unnamed protein product [Callosobruchus analis]CAI5857524.1 unnamed protein product [Callosobruchus analis]
MKLIIFWKISP